MRLRAITIAALGLAAATAPALAHTGHGHAHGLVAGFVHPFGGLDHVLAMLAVGLLAARLGGRASWAMPAAFVTLMVFGGALGMNGVALAHAEIVIALSVVVLGLVVAAALWVSASVGLHSEVSRSRNICRLDTSVMLGYQNPREGTDCKGANYPCKLELLPSWR